MGNPIKCSFCPKKYDVFNMEVGDTIKMMCTKDAHTICYDCVAYLIAGKTLDQIKQIKQEVK